MRIVLASAAVILLATTAVQAQAPGAEVSAAATTVIEAIGEACDAPEYEEECFRAMGRAITAAEPLSDDDKAGVYAKIRSYAERRPQWAGEIGRLLTDNNIPVTNPA
ncbi:MAG: hypothetical protein IT535_00365 [Bauldia sp.]|nr:hypothetical protein [Bauldia sp.]